MSNLLLVDDDDFVRSALSRALNRTGGFTVISAEHGRRALELLASEHVDAILTDLQMPVMDGLTLLAELFEKEVRLPVAVMTGQQIHADLRHRLQTYGIAAVFSKPVDVVLLADELQRVLDPKAVGRITGITLFGLLQLLEAAYEILGWPDPAVEIFYKRRARQRTVREPLQHVLMEAARLLDESARPTIAEERAVQTASKQDFDADSILAEVVKIDGALGAALVQATNGTVLGQVAVGRGLDMARAAKIAQDLVQSALRLRDGIEDIMITVDTQYHLMRFLGPGEDVVVHLVLYRERSSLGMARQQLAKLARISGLCGCR